MRTYHCIVTNLEFQTVYHTMQGLLYSAASNGRKEPLQFFPGMVTKYPSHLGHHIPPTRHRKRVLYSFGDMAQCSANSLRFVMATLWIGYIYTCAGYQTVCN